ncbi:MAG: protein kinase [Planctomycetes bacterium]|nr:protein kinase [Planctomycetota bacterium]
MNLPPHIDRYQVQAILGEGGSGTVVRAFDPRVGCTVAIKILHNPGGAESRVRTRLQREIQALCRLQHPNIVKARDVGELGGRPYVVLDFIEGASLEDRINTGGALDPDDAVDLVRGLCRAIAHAHEHGVLHRDLNPRNVLLARDGTPVLIDFGLTLQTDSQTDARLSSPGAFLGTPGYWAPEQAKGQLDRMGPGTDVFGLGGILVFALTGKPPYSGDSVPDLLAAAMSPSPIDLSAIPAYLRPACSRALAKDPDQRFDLASEFGDALGAAMAGSSRKGGRAWIGFALAALVLIGAAIAVLNNEFAGPPPQTPSRPQASPREAPSLSPQASRTQTPEATPTRSATQPTPAQTPQEIPDLRARVTGARSLLQEGKFKEGRTILEQVLREAPDDPEARLALGIACFHLNDGANARVHLERALEQRPKHLMALDYVGRLEAAETKFAAAAKAYAAAAKLYPARPRFRIEWARNLLMLGEMKQALQVLDSPPSELHKIRRWKGARQLLRVRVLANQGRIEEAIADLDTLLKFQDKPFLHFQRAVLHLAIGREKIGDRELDLACEGGIPLPYIWRNARRKTPLPRLNQPEKPTEASRWTTTIFKAMAEKVPLKTLIDQARLRAPALLKLRRLSEGYCYLGLYHEREERLKRARRAYELCVQVGYRDDTEYIWAKARLGTLPKSSSDKSR